MRLPILRACLVSLWLATVALGCSNGPGPALDDGGTLPRRDLGESCSASEDCLSTLCVDVGGGRAVCTETCAGDADCPGQGWACVQPDGFDATICGCESAGREICGNHVDDDCNGRIDDCRLCGGVGVPQDDHDNCGECGHACRADQECHAETCRCVDATAMECGGTCIDVSTSTQHCGSCTNTCSVEQICAGGACACPSGSTACGTSCVDTQSDDRHCGACGHACASTQYCLDGTCTCPNAWTLCGGTCVDTTTSATDCGTCGHACRSDQHCAAGACACGAGTTDCGTVCMDTRADAMNCGACGHACEPGETCSASACHCATGLHCGGTCIASYDAMNCGACGNVCPAPEICSASACRCPVSGNTFCASSGSCVDLRVDPNNCGTCDRVCDPATVCSAGSCVCPTSGQAFCPGEGCVSLATDPTHCGACATACAPGQTCSASRCVCPGSMPYLCPTVGCVDESSDPMNCGGCGNTCRSGETCSSYACRCPLTSQRWCAAQGTCIDVYSDPMNCGSCGSVCPATATCTSGTCRCDTAGQTACGTSCVDLTSDSSHCGNCTRVCGGGRSCIAGACWCPAPSTGTEVRVTTSLDSSSQISVASDGAGTALVAWMDQASTGNSSVSYVLLDPTGTPLGPATTVSTLHGALPSVAWNGSEWAVVWNEYVSSHTTHFQRISTAGALIGSPQTISGAWPTSYGSVTSNLTSSSTLGWCVLADYRDSAVFQALGDGTMPLPLPVQVYASPGSASSYRANFAAGPGGGLGVRYDAFSTAYFRDITPAGSLGAGPTTLSSLVDTRLGFDGTSYVLAGERTIYATTYHHQVFAMRGDPPSSIQVAIDSTANPPVPHDNFALDVSPTDTMLVWGTHAVPSGTAETIHLTRWGAGSTPVLLAPDVTLVSSGSASTTERLGIANLGAGRYLLVWADTRWGQLEIYAQPFSIPACI